MRYSIKDYVWKKCQSCKNVSPRKILIIDGHEVPLCGNCAEFVVGLLETIKEKEEDDKNK